MKVDDTTLSGIRISQVSLLSRQWRLLADEATVPGALRWFLFLFFVPGSISEYGRASDVFYVLVDGELHPQESLIFWARAASVTASDRLLCHSVPQASPKDLTVAPYKVD